MLAETLLARHKIAIRVCHNFRGLGDGYFRLAVRTNDDNRQLLAALHEEISIGASAAYLPKRRTPAIMFQGVSSSSGKSVLTAAFLRIMTQDGYRAAPFKAQNMALNSYVTLDGKEIGRAQVTQAQACGLEPDTRMNPVLLKPNSDTGSQVIMLGKPIGSMTAREYYRYKEEAFKTVKQAYDSLSSEFQVMALEGAGSCGEVNLKRYDIVNMAMAEYAGAKVLIVGDIDRGGVFASFAGIMETLAEWERRLVGGFVINKFRGDKSLLKDALDFTFSHCGRPTFGVVPYIHELGLPEEDQAVVHQYRKSWNGARVKVAVVRLRHVSNFTDFDPLSMEPDVELMAVTRPEELSGADVVILPGSKNVIGDLNVLKDSGVLQAVKKMAMEGRGRLVGICGGFQMMGLEILDPQGIESASGRAEGLGLLAVSTRLEPEKTLKRTAGVHVESGIPVNGYEIHHGVTKGEGIHPAVTGDDGGLLGVMSPDGRHWGSYLHGIFHNGRFRRWFIDRLRTEKGEEPLGLQGAVYDVDQALDRLADGVRNSMDVDAVYKLMGIK